MENNKNSIFLLGGADGEMRRIREVLDENGQPYIDKKLGWGAVLSAYQAEIAEAQTQGLQPVGIELTEDTETNGVALIDHHNERANEPASLLQVLKMLEIEPTRRDKLIAANDSGYIPAMIEAGATNVEIAEIRAYDRAAQGVTTEQEAEAERAIAEAKTINGVTVVEMAHSKTATITDRLFDPETPQNILVLSADGESNYFGNPELVKALQGVDTGEKTPEGYAIYSHFGGWIGGEGLNNPDSTAFWGGYADQNEIKQFVTDFFFEKTHGTEKTISN